MFKNCYVRCVGYNRAERKFTIGKVYQVVNGAITRDDGYTYTPTDYRGDVLNHLSGWYRFEIITDGNLEDWEDVRYCNHCGRAVLDDDGQYINDDFICNDCIDRYFRECCECGELYYMYDMRTLPDGHYICDDCACDYYTSCDNCGELIHNDYVCYDEYDNPYCPDCYEEMKNRIIQRYNYKPDPIFYGASPYIGELFMGVELEIDNGGECHEHAKTLLDIVNSNTYHMYAKHDGSIDDGFELVSHPATLEYHRDNIAWPELMTKAVDMGYRSHDTDSCGLHVHVSRDGLGNTIEKQDETISKIVYFIENNWYEILKFTRRTESNLRRWASRYGIEKDIPTTYKKAKEDFNRYRAINLQNYHTIEFRVFRGTLNHNTFVATLQLVHDICMVCKNATMGEIEKMNWFDFISRIDTENRPELMKYLKIRGLYV